MELRLELDPSTMDVSVDAIQTWALGLTEVARRILPYCVRRDARHRVGASLRGLLSPVERKNGWHVAEAVGDAPPYSVQHLLGRAQGEAQDVCKGLGT
jgi:hypothetical protein